VGLPGGEPQQHRRAPVVDQGVDFGGPPAARAPQGMMVGLSGQIPVIQSCPRCGSGHRRRTDERARWSNQSRSSRHAPPRLIGHRHARRPTSPHTCRRSTSVDGAPKSTAMHQIQRGHRATANQCGTATRSLPTCPGDHSMAGPDATTTMASPAISLPTTNQKSDHGESYPQASNRNGGF
jgi:hypothetical protein